MKFFLPVMLLLALLTISAALFIATPQIDTGKLLINVCFGLLAAAIPVGVTIFHRFKKRKRKTPTKHRH
jgi:hypothetical protein